MAWLVPVGFLALGVLEVLGELKLELAWEDYQEVKYQEELELAGNLQNQVMELELVLEVSEEVMYLELVGCGLVLVLVVYL